MTLTSLLMLLPVFQGVSPLIKMGVSTLAPDIDKAPSSEQLVMTLDMLAKADGMELQEFVSSGRATTVIQSRLLNRPVPDKGAKAPRLVAIDTDGVRSYKVIP